MNHMTDETSYSTPWDALYDEEEEYFDEEYFDEEAADEERFGILDEIYL